MKSYRQFKLTWLWMVQNMNMQTYKNHNPWTTWKKFIKPKPKRPRNSKLQTTGNKTYNIAYKSHEQNKTKIIERKKKICQQGKIRYKEGELPKQRGDLGRPWRVMERARKGKESSGGEEGHKRRGEERIELVF